MRPTEIIQSVPVAAETKNEQAPTLASAAGQGAQATAVPRPVPAPVSPFRRRMRSLDRFVRFMVQNTAQMAYVRYLRPKVCESGKITIVTPTHNRLHTLREAIASVRAQTYGNWEQIIVSDGPDPRVPALVAEIGDPRIRSFHTRKLNVMGNYQRNFALRHATGEFVLYLDDDNVIYPECLQVMVRGFESPDIGYVVCPIHYGDTIKAPKPSFAYREIDLLNYMIRRKLVERVGGQRVHGIADYLLIRDVARISRGKFLDTLIGHHR